MKGVERADSVVVNPHKWLFVPLDFSALYVRRPEALRAVFALTPEYLRGDSAAGSDGGGGGHAIDYMDYGIQLGRRFRALKAWMVFRSAARESRPACASTAASPACSRDTCARRAGGAGCAAEHERRLLSLYD